MILKMFILTSLQQSQLANLRAPTLLASAKVPTMLPIVQLKVPLPSSIFDPPVWVRDFPSVLDDISNQDEVAPSHMNVEVSVGESFEYNFNTESFKLQSLPIKLKPITSLSLLGKRQPNLPSTPSLPNKLDSILPPPVKKSKKMKTQPPTNPLKLSFFDSEGQSLDPNSEEFGDQYAIKNKRDEKTRRKIQEEYKRFIDFLDHNESAGPEFVEKMINNSLPEQAVATKLGLFIMNRVNLTKWEKSEVLMPLDTSTLDRVWSQVCSGLAENTEYKPQNNPVFDKARRMKTSAMKQAKLHFGLGELAGQAHPLTRAEVDALLHSDHLHLYGPTQIITLFYVTFVLFHGPRVRKEVYNVTRGEFHPVFNADGTLMCVIYVPRRALKKDQGDSSSTSNKSSFVFKRPASMPCPSEPKLDFWTILQRIFVELDKLPHEGSRSTQRIFYQMKNKLPKDGSSFFINNKMGEKVFDGLLTDAINRVGIITEGTRISNQSLRVTSFNMHDLLGLSDADMAVTAGHSSDKTNRIYRRKNGEKRMLVGGGLQQLVTREPVVFPDLNIVRYRDGTVREAKRFLPVVDVGPTEAGTIVINMMDLPIHPVLKEIEISPEYFDEETVELEGKEKEGEAGG